MRISFSATAILLFAFFVTAARPARAQDRYAIGAQIALENLPELAQTSFGYGFRFTYGLYPPFVALDSEIDEFPTHSTGNFDQTQFFLGPKIGARVGRWGFFFKVRPGLAAFGGGSDPARLTHRTDFALDVGGGLEYYFAPHLALRWDLGDNLTYYGGGGLTSGPGEAGAALGTRGHFESTVGFLVHF